MSAEAPYACPCLDTGLVPVSGQDDAWRPCRRCNPGGYARWEAGKTVPRFAGQPAAPTGGRVGDLRDSLASTAAKLDGIE